MIEGTDADVEELLEVHVINAGVGESIVIRMPGDRWGVVDCYSPSVTDPDANPTVQFLKDRGVSRLEFLCLTHPHNDHYRGMSHLLEIFRPHYFWRSACMTVERLKRIILHGDAEARQGADPKGMETVKDLVRTFALARKMKRAGLQVILLSGIKPAYPFQQSIISDSPPVKIIGIAPSGNMIEQYEESLDRCFTKTGALKPRVPALKHNDISIALVVQFGSTRIILGGDVEANNWLATVASMGPAELASQAVKVSHHGSRTGYIPGLWGNFSRLGGTHAIITPSRRHRLPTRDAVEHIRSHARRVFTTCAAVMTFDGAHRGAAWDSYSPQVQSALRREFSGFQSVGDGDLGVCSLSFDSNGNCQQIQLSGGAAELTDDMH